MAISKCATFREGAGLGWTIPVKNTFINFDVHAQQPTARVRAATCPCSAFRRAWEHATQELCHAMAPRVSRPTTVQRHVLPRNSTSAPACGTELSNKSAEKAVARALGASPAVAMEQTPLSVSSACAQQGPQQGDTDALSEVSTTSSERVQEKAALETVVQKWSRVPSRKKVKNVSLASVAVAAANSKPRSSPSGGGAVTEPRAFARSEERERPQPSVQVQPQTPSTPQPQAQSPLAVREAQTQVQRESPRAPLEAKGEGKGKGGGGLLHFRKIDVGIEDDPHFRVVQRLIGPKGKHMQDILCKAKGAKIWIIGRGSRSWEDDVGPLVVCVGATSGTAFETAVTLVKDLLTRVHDDHRKFRR